MLDMIKKIKRLKPGFESLFLIALLAFLIFHFSCSPDRAEKRAYLETAEKILEKGLKEEAAFSLLEKLTNIGPRLTGSPQAESAVELMRRQMEESGLDNVHLEPTLVEHWVRGEAEQARILSSANNTIPVPICALGGSVATPETGIKAEVLEVTSFDELSRLKEKARGKIVFFNRPMDRTLIDTFSSYGRAAEQRVSGAAEAAKAGALAAVVRSMTLRVDDFPHTGLMHYNPNVPQIPAACISTKGADLLSELLKKEPDLKMFIKLNCRNLQPVTSHNVIGQLTGYEKPNEIILLGGHLDSWDLGTGAHDDGSGCVQSVEALRLIKELGLRPKRTIRAVLFMNEEFGGSGGRDYAGSEARKGEIHLIAVESDRGGFLPLGIGVSGSPLTVKRIQSWGYLFKPLGIQWIRRGGGGVDIAPLGQEGTIMASVIPDSQKYFDFHHSARDVLDAVHPRELELGAVAMAVFAFVLAQEGIH